MITYIQALNTEQMYIYTYMVDFWTRDACNRYRKGLQIYLFPLSEAHYLGFLIANQADINRYQATNAADDLTATFRKFNW